MSQVYATEPQTSGKVTLETSHGPIEIQLWCRECPATTKFFLQLCVDGYFDDIKFHRILSGFLIQTGLRDDDKWSSSEWKQYRSLVQTKQVMERRRLETHARIRFNHRGQVAMAMPIGEQEQIELEPQFFITLDEAPYLDGKHVVIGSIASSPTVFNALRIGNTTEVNKNGQPVDWEHAPRIISTKVNHYQFDNGDELVPTNNVPWKVPTDDLQKKKKKRKGKRDVNVLSFGHDELMEDSGGGGGMQSSFDVDAIVDKGKSAQGAVKQTSITKEEDSKSKAAKRPKLHEEKEETPKPSSSPSIAAVSKDTAESLGPKQQTNATREEPISAMATTNGTGEAFPVAAKKKKQPSAVEAMRLKYKKKSTNKKQRESDTMAKLLQFQNKVRVKQPKSSSQQQPQQDTSLASRMAKRAEQEQDDDSKDQYKDSGLTYHGQVLDSDQEDDQEWLGTRFHCRQHMDQSAGRGGDGRDMDDYLVIDDKGNDRTRHHRSNKGHSSHKRHDGGGQRRNHHR